MAGFVSLVWIAIGATIASVVIALLTKKKEGLLSYAALAFTFVVVYEIVKVLIDYVLTLI